MTARCYYCGTSLPVLSKTHESPLVTTVTEWVDYSEHAEHCTLANVCGAPIDADPARDYLPERLATACRRRPKYADGRCRFHVGA